MRGRAWIAFSVAAVSLALSLLALPARLEGPVLVPLSPGHALTRVDAVALLPLLAGVAVMYGGIWRRRDRLLQSAGNRPGIGALTVFGAGAGLGLLLASSFSSFFWWWAIGAALLALTTITALAIVARQ